MSSQTRKSRSSSIAATAEKATGVQEDAVATTSTASDPSGLRAPDGTNSADTPQSSGDAAGDASADPVKPQVNADHTEAIQATAANETPMPEVEASDSGNISEPSQGAAVGAGANASPDALAADFGRQMRATLISLVQSGLLPDTYFGSSDPLHDLAEENARLRKELSQYGGSQAEEDTVLSQVVSDAETGSNHPLTKALLNDWDDSRVPVVRITSKVPGFRRGGTAHPAQADHDIRNLTPDQLEAFLSEPNLTVELV